MDAFTPREQEFNSMMHAFSQEENESDESLGLFSEVQDRGQRFAEDSSPGLSTDVKLVEQTSHDVAATNVAGVRRVGLLRTDGAQHPVCKFFQGGSRRRQRGRQVLSVGTLRNVRHRFKHGLSSNNRRVDLCCSYGISVLSSNVLEIGATTRDIDPGEYMYAEDDKSDAVNGINNGEVDSDAETIDLEFENLQAARASEVHVRQIYAPDSMPDSIPPGMESYTEFVLKSLMTSYDPKTMKK